ncbi:MAG: hypothetical protein WA359_03280 [Acidimicrobiales bacterium]
MFAHIRGAMPRPRVLLASIVATGVLLVPLGITAPPSGASSSFCTQYRAWLEGKLHSPISATGVPTAKTAAAWHTFAIKAEPIFAQMAEDAPNTKIKTRLDGIITIWKYYAKTTSTAKLVSFFNAHQTQWSGWYLIGQLSAEEACS